MERVKIAFAGAVEYLKDVRGEVRKVIWPDRQQVVRLTTIVVSMVTVIALIIWAFDSSLSAILGRLLVR
jgi:preprotein translocase subunit SecE